MDSQLVKLGFDYTRRRKKWVLLLAALGFSGYGFYRACNLPSVVARRRRLLKLFGAFISVAEMASDSTDMIGVVSRDLKEFIQSDSDQVPNSLRQISKITRSDEFSESVVGVTRALTLGILRGCRSETTNIDQISENSSVSDRVLDKLFSKSGSGFASVVVGSFAKNLVMALYSDDTNKSKNLDYKSSESNSVPRWVNVVCDDKCKELIGDCIKLFVSTTVTVYLEKTMNINTYNEIFSGLTNPKHERETRELLASICDGAIETFVRSSHQVLSSSKNSNVGSSSSSYIAIDTIQSPHSDLKSRKLSGENEDSGWVTKMSSTLAVPSNRRLVLDVTGKVTFETVRSFLEFLMEKLYDGLKRSLSVVHENIVERGIEVFQYVTVKSSVIVTLCLSLCLHVLDGPWILVPA